VSVKHDDFGALDKALRLRPMKLLGRLMILLGWLLFLAGAGMAAKSEHATAGLAFWSLGLLFQITGLAYLMFVRRTDRLDSRSKEAWPEY
jgi:hypothetical protein